FSIQPHCLITCARASSAAFPIRLFQFLSLFWAEFKLSFGHPLIVCLCSVFSMSISVIDQKARVALARLVLPGRAPDLFGDPGRVGTMGTASQVHAPFTHVNEKQHINRLHKHSFHREKVASQYLRTIVV